MKNDLAHKQQQVYQKRREWLKTLTEPGATRLSKTGLYAWLYKNDKEWLQKNPAVSRRGQSRSRVNWEERDLRMVELVKREAGRIYPLKGIRISKAELGRRVGSLSLIENRINKMPRTKECLEQIVETTKMYQFRRIKLIREDNIKISNWKGAKLAGIKFSVYENLVHKLKA